MFKFKKSLGALALGAALLTAAIPASADTDTDVVYKWVKLAYPGYKHYDFDSSGRQVKVWNTADDGFYVDCAKVKDGKCFVKVKNQK